MEVLLRYNIENLGQRGDVVRVRPGFARNYLFPRQLAVPVTAENRRRLEAEHERFMQEEMQRIEEFRRLAQKLEEYATVVIEANATAEGHLYGSVTGVQILDELSSAGFDLESRSVRLEQPVRRLGVFPVPIQLHPEVKLQLKLWVVSEGEEVERLQAPPYDWELPETPPEGEAEGESGAEEQPEEAAKE